MALTPGTRLGPYEIAGLLGSGGMGEVYEARDVRLDRRVAIKVLPAAIAADAERRARLEREARLVATLNHPHICALYDVGEHDGHAFLVMERLDGTTLAARLSPGALPLAEVLTLAAQIADALAAAHAQGIVHRDLKPANVMLTPGGAKLLDFGVARLTHGNPLDPLGPTSLTPITAEGMIVGTLKYMAPEQLQGRAVDHRADIFALGAILFEMLTGKSAFDGPDSASIIAAVISSEPPLATLPPSVSPVLARIVRICLAKDPAARWSSARDVALQLRGLLDEPSATHGVARTQNAPGAKVGWAVAALAGIVAIALAAVLAMLPSRDSAPVARRPIALSLLPPDQTLFVSGEAPQISPDGRRLAFVGLDAAGRNSLYVHELEGDVARPLPGTESASQPFWAPDSRRLGFFADGRLKTISIDGGAPQVLTRASVPRGGTWGSNDMIVFVPDPPLPAQRINANGGTPESVPLDDFRSRWFPSFLPDSRHYVFLALTPDRLGSMLRVGSLDSGESRELVPSRSSGQFVKPGHLLFRRDTSLVVQTFDPEALVLTGEPTVVASNAAFNAISYQTLVSASDTGVLAYRPSAPSNELIWIDAHGQRVGTVPTEMEHNAVCLTGDSTSAVYDAVDLATGAVDLWQWNLGTGSATRLTFNPAVDFYPVCAASGNDVVFSSLREGPPNLYRLSLGAPGQDRVQLDTPGTTIATSWSSDRQITYSAFARETSWDIWTVSTESGEPRPLVQSPAEERNGTLSTDGRWLAYVSNESERFEVYVQAVAPGGPKWQISRGGGQQPQWRRDGRELFYIAPDKRLIAVAVTQKGGTFSHGNERVIAQTRITGVERIVHGTQYAVSSDGSRILIVNAVQDVRPFSVIADWPSALVAPPR